MNNPYFWLFALALCSIALMTEASHFIHVLLFTRQRLWCYLFVVIAVAKCIWSFAVVWYILNTMYSFLPAPGIVTFGGIWRFYVRIILPLIHLQVGIMIASFTIMLLLERMMLPRIDRAHFLNFTKNRLFLVNL